MNQGEKDAIADQGYLKVNNPKKKKKKKKKKNRKRFKGRGETPNENSQYTLKRLKLKHRCRAAD